MPLDSNDDEVTPVSSIRLWIAHDIDKIAKDTRKYYQGKESLDWYNRLIQISKEMKGE
jgi:hypothetical protein